MRREGCARPTRGGRARAEDEERSREALKVADSLFSEEKGGQEARELAKAVRAAHGSADLAAACRAYLDAIGPPKTAALASIFLDAGEKELSVTVLDDLLRQKDDGSLEVEGGLKRQIRILSEDFDDDLASRAEELLE